jgi:cytochrome c
MLTGAVSAAAADGDAAKGEKVFKKCKACHVVDSDKNKVGPTLAGVVGRAAAGVESYTKYSKAMQAKAAEGLVWDEASLDAYLAKPKDFVPKTKMAFPGLKKEQDRADIIAYLKSFSQ